MSEQLPAENIERGTGLGDTDRFEAGYRDFKRSMDEEIPGQWVVFHPYRGESIDAAEFGAEVRLRKQLDVPPVEFWSAPLREVDN